MNVDHIGYAVKNIDASRQAFEELGYVLIVNDTDRNIFISFGRWAITASSWYRLDPALPSPVDGMLKKSRNTPYHICYTSSRFEDDIKELQQKRFLLTIPPAPACAFGGRRVAFLYHLQIGLLELVEA
ncbi:MAG: VOC family protein [Roseburia hominis]